MLRFKFNVYAIAYCYLVLLRLILVLIPQTGYIHPDEFFQSVEVLIGKFFDFECSPPWEFNTTFPIRSMTIPYFTVGMTYKALININSLTRTFWGTSILSPYSLLITPRLLMCMFSFILDYALYKICSNNNEKYKSRLVILGSSYVTLVYATRTFSNTMELVIFSVLLYLVCESLTFSNILIKKREYINYRYEQSKTLTEKAKFHKLRLFLISDSFRNCFVISTVSVLGFFNRPTFVAFAVVPVFFWLYRGIGTKSVGALQFYLRTMLFALCSIPTFLFCIVVDSFYYGYISWGEIGMLDVSIDSFVFTPLNFFKYNTDPDNLVIHGLHPRFLHALVNVPLLFNVLGACAAATLVRYVHICSQRKLHLLPSIRSVKCLMTLSFITPIAVLSIFPHQEPRFLIPVVLPLAYLCGMDVLPQPDDTVAETTKIQPKKKQTKAVKPSYALLKIWLTINTALVVFYGFVHQGGVMRAVYYLYQDLETTPMTTEFHIVTSHIYSLPESLLMQKATNKLYRKGRIQYSVSRRVFLYEEGSKDVDYILEKAQVILGVNKEIFAKHKSKAFKVYLLISSSLDESLLRSVDRGNYLKLNLLERFYPHVSLEAFPDLSRYCTDITKVFHTENCTVLAYDRYFEKVFGSFALSLYDVVLTDT